MYYIEDMSVRAAKTIRMREDIYHQAKVAAVVFVGGCPEAIRKAGEREKRGRNPSPVGREGPQRNGGPIIDSRPDRGPPRAVNSKKRTLWGTEFDIVRASSGVPRQ